MRPDYPDTLIGLGAALFNAGKFEEAAKYYREAIRLNPQLAHAHYNLAQCLLRLNDSAGAQAEFSEAHRLDPSLGPPKYSSYVRDFDQVLMLTEGNEWVACHANVDKPPPFETKAQWRYHPADGGVCEVGVPDHGGLA